MRQTEVFQNGCLTGGEIGESIFAEKLKGEFIQASEWNLCNLITLPQAFFPVWDYQEIAFVLELITDLTSLVSAQELAFTHKKRYRDSLI
jgi:hypothetical protein